MDCWRYNSLECFDGFRVLNLYGIAVLNAFGTYKEALLPDLTHTHCFLHLILLCRDKGFPTWSCVFLSAKSLETEIGNKVGNLKINYWFQLKDKIEKSSRKQFRYKQQDYWMCFFICKRWIRKVTLKRRSENMQQVPHHQLLPFVISPTRHH